MTLHVGGMNSSNEHALAPSTKRKVGSRALKGYSNLLFDPTWGSFLMGLG